MLPNIAVNLTGMFKINQKKLGWVGCLGLNFGPLQISMMKNFQVKRVKDANKGQNFISRFQIHQEVGYMLVARLVNPVASGTSGRFAGVHT